MFLFFSFPWAANPGALDLFAFPPARKLPVPPASHSQHTGRIHRHPILLDPYHPLADNYLKRTITEDQVYSNGVAQENQVLIWPTGLLQ